MKTLLLMAGVLTTATLAAQQAPSVPGRVATPVRCRRSADIRFCQWLED